MRVLLVSQELPPATPGGIGGYTASTARGLARRGHEVHVLSCLRGQARSDEVVDGVHVHRRGELPLPLERSTTGRRLRCALSVRHELRRLPVQPDVVEAPEWMAEALLLPRRLPLVVTLHSALGLVTREAGATLGADGRLADRLEARSARRAHVVTSPSGLLAEEVARTGWFTGDVTVVPTAVDLEAWDDTPAVLTPPRVVLLGRVEERKGVLVLLEALASLRAHVPDLELLVVGRDGLGDDGRAYAERVRARAAELGPWVQLPGGLPRHELRALCASARVLAVPSRWDNYPMVALEGLASARPVVVTATTGTAPLIAGLDPASVVPADDAAALAHALRPYLESAEHAATVGKAGRERVERLVVEALDGREEAYARAVVLAGRLRR